MLNPEAKTRLTYIVDFTQKSSAIGKQTFSWCQQEVIADNSENLQKT
jgi:hypothetical protein